MMRSFFDPNIFEIYHSLSLSLSRHFSSLYLYEILYSFKKKKIVTPIQNLRSNFKIENIKSSHWKEKKKNLSR